MESLHISEPYEMKKQCKVPSARIWHLHSNYIQNLREYIRSRRGGRIRISMPSPCYGQQLVTHANARVPCRHRTEHKARWWLGSRHLLYGFAGTLLWIGYQLYTSQISETTTYITLLVPGIRPLRVRAPPMPSRKRIR